jgi:hypothetical protein
VPLPQIADVAGCLRTDTHRLGKRAGGGEDRPRPEAVSSALSALSCPMRAQVLPRQHTVPGQGGGDRFAYKRGVAGSNPAAPTTTCSGRYSVLVIEALNGWRLAGRARGSEVCIYRVRPAQRPVRWRCCVGCQENWAPVCPPMARVCGLLAALRPVPRRPGGRNVRGS